MEHSDDLIKEKAIKKILQRECLFEIRDKKLRRIFKDPFWTPLYFILNIVSRAIPIWVSKKMPWGEKMSFYLPEGNQIFYYGFCEANLAIFLLRLIKPGETFIDIGANIGYYSKLASFLVGESGKVLAIEATPRTFLTLKINCLPQKNITAFNVALSDSTQDLTLTDYGPKYSGSNSLNPLLPKTVKDFIQTKGKTLNIKTTALDDLLKGTEIKPDFIKLDVEGYESKILSGMATVLNKSRPILSVEMCRHPEWQDNVNETFRILSEKDYQPYEISSKGYLTPTSQTDYKNIDIIFIPQEKVNKMDYLIISNQKIK